MRQEDHEFETGIFDSWDCPKNQGPTMMQNFKTSVDGVHSFWVIFLLADIWRFDKTEGKGSYNVIWSTMVLTCKASFDGGQKLLHMLILTLQKIYIKITLS